MFTKKIFSTFIFTVVLMSGLSFSPGIVEAQCYDAFGNSVDCQPGDTANTCYDALGNPELCAAQDNNSSGNCDSNSPQLCNPLKANSIEALFRSIIEIVMVFAIPLIVFFIVYAGFLYVTARGNVEKIQTAHKALLYAIIGGLLIIGANVLIDVISGTVNSINSP